MFKNALPSRTSSPSPDIVLALVNQHLEIAHNLNDPEIALMFSDYANALLLDLKRTIKKSLPGDCSADQTLNDGIATAFFLHSNVLNKWGYADKAQVSLTRAEKRGSASILEGLTRAKAPRLTDGSKKDSRVPDIALIPAEIFPVDISPPSLDWKFPDPDEPLLDTPQLVSCLSLLNASPLPESTLDPSVLKWLQDTKANAKEKLRLRTLAINVLTAFFRDELKDKGTVAEILSIAPVLAKDEFRILFQDFTDSIKKARLLKIPALCGLAQLIRSASPGYLDAEDLDKVLGDVSKRLKETHEQSPTHIFQLIAAVSHVLDAMADINITTDIKRVEVYEPLLEFLYEWQRNGDPHLAYQAAYTFQALLSMGNDESAWKSSMRRTGKVVKRISGLVSAAKGLDILQFIEHLYEGLEGVTQTGKLIFVGVGGIATGERSLVDNFRAGHLFKHKRAWYSAVRTAHVLLHEGEHAKFKKLVCEAPCRRDPNFQWGICQSLGNLTANSLWDIDARRSAVLFLGEIYRDDWTWNYHPQVKEYILEILQQLSSSSDGHLQGAASLLQDLEKGGSAAKQELYKGQQRKGHTQYPLDTSLSQPVSSSLLNRVQNKFDIRPCLQEFQRRRLLDQEQRNIIYISPQAKANRERPDDELFDLTAKVNEFLAGDQKVLLIMGDSGAGKSTFSLELERDLWDSYDKYKRRIPLFVTLPTIENPEQDLIAKHLRRYDFNEDHIRQLKSDHEFILICDGYDGCHQQSNLYTSNRLNQPGEWNVQMLISCRSEYLGHDYRRRFQPGDRNDWTGGAMLQEAVISPFSEKQIKHYIETYVANNASHWKVEDYLQVLDRFPGLKDLVRNPFLLTLSLSVLPDMVDLGKNRSMIKVTRIALYDKFVEQWVDRGMARLHNRKFSESDAMAFKDLCADGLSQNAIRFTKDLSVAIFENQDGAPVVEYSPFRDKDKWQHAFFSQVDGRNLLREACPIVRIGNSNQYRFIHRSVLEYGLARAVFEPQPEDKNEQSKAGPATRAREQRSMGGALSFHGSRAEKELSASNELVLDFTSPLYRRSYVNELSIVRFLAERVHQDPMFKRQLHSFIEQSKVDERWNIAAANAMTILIKAGIRFNEADLKGIRIPGADLSGGQFDSAQLQEADLSNVTLHNSWLRQANLSNARMEGVEVGEQPYLTEGSSVRCCAYSPDGKALVVGLYNGSISVYDTSNWTRTYKLTGHNREVLSVVYSPNGHQIASYSSDKTVWLWDAQTGAPGPNLRGHTREVKTVVYALSGQQIALSSPIKMLQSWDAQIGASDPLISGVVYSPSGQQIASRSDDNTVQLWDAQTGAPGPILSGHIDIVRSVVYSPSGQQIASGSDDGTVRLWDAQAGAPGVILRGHHSRVTSVVYSPSGQQIASGSGDMTVRLWDPQTGASGPILSGHNGWVTSVVYSPSGQQIASGSGDTTIRLWNTQTGAPGPILHGHIDTVFSVAYSPSGQQIASGSDDKTVRLWDAQTGVSGHILSGHTGEVWRVIYSPSGQQIASGGVDKTVRLWNAQTGTPGPILGGHTDTDLDMAYSRGGQHSLPWGENYSNNEFSPQMSEGLTLYGVHSTASTPDPYLLSQSEVEEILRKESSKDKGSSDTIHRQKKRKHKPKPTLTGSLTDSYVNNMLTNVSDGVSGSPVETSQFKDLALLTVVEPEIDRDTRQLPNQEQTQKRLELLQRKRLDLQRELQMMQERYRDIERSALLSVAEMRRRITTILERTEELQEDSKPKLFIVLPTRCATGNTPEMHPSTKFRLYFLCECSTDTNSEDDDFSQGIHLVKHEGYDIRNSDEFFQKYGPYVLTMLQMVKYGFVATGVTVPALAHFKQIEGIDAIQQTLDISQATIGSLVDDSIAFIRDQVANMADKTNIPAGSPELDNQEVLEGTDLRLLESYLEVSDSNYVNGNLYRIVDSEGDLKWICLDHYHDVYETSAIKKLKEIVAADCNGQFIEERGFVDVQLQTSTQAEQFYSAMVKARCVLDLKVSLNWSPTQDDLKILADAVTKANIARLRITGCGGVEDDRSIRSYSELDSTLFKPILQLMSNGKLQTIEFYRLLCLDFLYVNVSDMRSAPGIRELTVEWTASLIVDHRTTFTAILAKCPMLVKLTVETEFAQDVLVYMLHNLSLYPRLKIFKIKDIRELNYSFELGISRGCIQSLDVLSFDMCHWELGGMKELLLGGFLTEIDLTLNGEDTDLDRLREIVRHNPKLTRAGLCIDHRYVEVIVCAVAATRDNFSETGDINILRGLEQQIHRWRGGAQPGAQQGRSIVQHS